MVAPSTGFPESRGGPGPGVAAAGSGGRPGGRDADRLGQVLGNLLENDARFARSRIDVSVEARAGSVSITVDDDGPGLAEGDRERVFDRLARLARPFFLLPSSSSRIIQLDRVIQPIRLQPVRRTHVGRNPAHSARGLEEGIDVTGHSLSDKAGSVSRLIHHQRLSGASLLLKKVRRQVDHARSRWDTPARWVPIAGPRGPR